jgi:hypothetical protein
MAVSLALPKHAQLLMTLCIELMGRRENFDVIEVPEEAPNLIGQAPLEVLDFVVDSRGQKLVPNPAHGGEQMTEEYSEL